MNSQESRSLSDYVRVADLNAPHGISLVKDIKTGNIYVRKDLNIYNLSIYRFLADNRLNGIPAIVDLFENDRTLTVIEEYIEGSTLSELLESEMPKDFAAAVNILCELCGILSTLHSRKPPIIHRDIKPSNIMISNSGQVYLLDFNAAKYLDPEAEKDTILLGTQGYAAPEQYGFASSTEQTDIYAMGILLKNIAKSFPENETAAYKYIWEKCTRLDPSDRYNSVSELKKDLLCPSGASQTSKRKYHRFLPPGFRTLTPWKMIIAAIFYVLFILLFIFMKLNGVTSPAQTVFEKTIFALMCLSVIWIPFNYLNVQKLIPLCHSRFLPVRILGVILLILLILFILILLLIIISGIVF